MKKLFFIPILLFTLIFSSNAYSKWTKVTETTDGNQYYLDYDRIRKVDGYLYYWYLSNFAQPINGRIYSASNYAQGDCKLLRFKRVSTTAFKRPMGKGFIGSRPHKKKNQDWDYPHPNSPMESVLRSVCDN